MKCIGGYTREQLQERCGDCDRCLCVTCTEKTCDEQCFFNCSIIANNQKASKGCSKGLSGDQIGNLCLSQDACDGCPCDTCEDECCSDGV